MLHISGDGFGYVATDKEYRDYHLIVEYKWGKKTDGGKYVRNSGILLHATGPDGGAGGTWMASIECQLAQGCVGDLIVIRGKDDKGEAHPGPAHQRRRPRPRQAAALEEGRRRRGPSPSGQLWWSQHDPDFKELLDTRGKDDVESPLGEWTRVECVCDGEPDHGPRQRHDGQRVLRRLPRGGQDPAATPPVLVYVKGDELITVEGMSPTSP